MVQATSISCVNTAVERQVLSVFTCTACSFRVLY